MRGRKANFVACVHCRQMKVSLYPHACDQNTANSVSWHATRLQNFPQDVQDAPSQANSVLWTPPSRGPKEDST